MNPYKERYTVGVSTKELFINMDNIFSAVKGGLESYCNKVYSHISFNQMWTMKYCKDILESFNSRYSSRKLYLLKIDFYSLQTIPLENA